MSSYYGDFLAGKVVRCRFNSDGTSGPSSLTGGAVTVSKDGADVTPSGGVTLAADVGGTVGRNHVVVDMSADPATFTAGSDYAVRLSAGTVAGVPVAGQVVGEWSVQARSGEQWTAMQTDSNVNDGTPTSGGFAAAAGLDAVDSAYVGQWLCFTSGADKGCRRQVTSYAGPTRRFGFATPFPTAPANGDTFKVV